MGDKIHRSYTAQYRADAVALAKEVGPSVAAKQLRVPADTLYTWVARAKSGSLPLSLVAPDPKVSLDLAERLKVLEQENNALKKENAALLKERQILEDAAIFFAKRQKK